MTKYKTHRCGEMPKGYSLRRYFSNGRRFQLPEPGGWVLGKEARDWDYCVDYLDDITPFANEHVKFCPWCGERLG